MKEEIKMSRKEKTQDKIRTFRGNDGLIRIADCLKNDMTEREIADKLGISKSKVHAGIEKLRKICKTMLDYDLANAQKTLASV